MQIKILSPIAARIPISPGLSRETSEGLTGDGPYLVQKDVGVAVVGDGLGPIQPSQKRTKQLANTRNQCMLLTGPFLWTV